MKMTNILASTLAALALVSSCGKNSGSKSSSLSPGERTNPQRPNAPERTEEEEEVVVRPPADGSNIQGMYRAMFTTTLNPQVNGTIPGSVTLLREEDKFMVYLRLFAGGPRAWHQQAIYMGTRCPTIKDDINKDGYIDILEARKVLGKVILPLDANISSQSAGRNFYPLSDLSGSYHYERLTSFQRLFNDLKSEDKDPEDHITKLAPDEGIEFVGKAVMIQGTAEGVLYPETVASTPRHRPHQTLPIVCGIFEKVTKEPGAPDDGIIPGPVAEVVDDQDRPAPEGEGEVPGWEGGAAGGGTTGTNEHEEEETTDGDSGGYSEDDETTGRSSSSGGSTSGRTTSGRTTSGRSTSGGSTSGGSTSGGSTSGGSTSGGSTSGGSTSGETTGGTTGESTGGESTDSTEI